MKNNIQILDKVTMNTLRLKCLLLAFVLSSISIFAATGLILRDTSPDGLADGGVAPHMTFKGQYDIKMVSSVALQAAWIKSANGQPYAIDTIVTEEEKALGGTYLSRNNYYDGGDVNAVKTDANVGWLAAKANHPTATGTALVYTDCDNDMSTFQSSAARLDFGDESGCTQIKAAYLYWSGVSGGGGTTQYAAYPGIPSMNSHAGGATGGTSGTSYQTIRFKTPTMSNYVTISPATAAYKVRDVLQKTNSSRYMCMADVTSLVQNSVGGGLFWVADLKTSSYLGTSGGASAGWSLVVIYSPPNCPPRVIKFWDGDGSSTAGAGPGTTITLKFGPGEVPASGNSVSYLGFIGLDGEDTAPDALTKLEPDLATETVAQVTARSLAEMKTRSLTFNGGNGDISIQPFTDGSQPPTPAWDGKGTYIPEVYWGMVSSQITSWDEEKQTNGNQLPRIPNGRITFAYDAHHIKLPPNALAANVAQATIKLPTEYTTSGWVCPFVYMAIQTLQPDLKLTKSAENTTIGLNQDVTYVLKVENIGPKALAVGAYVVDTLDKTVDFVPGSVMFYDKNGTAIASPPSYTITGQSLDAGEYLKINLPAIAAGNGSTATDFVTIKFKVKVKDYSRTDIWGYGCNRYVKNKAAAYYKADDGTDLITGSNSSASCDGQGAYYLTPVVDAALESQYQLTHNISATLTTDVNQAIINGTKLYINKTLKGLLATQLGVLNLPKADTVKYSIFNESGIQLLNSAYFTQVEPVQMYTAEADFGGGCVEVYNFTIIVAKIPSYTVTANTKPTCPGVPNGQLKISVKDGTPSYTVTLKDASGTIVYSASKPNNTTDPVEFVIDGLLDGKYDIVVKDQGNSGFDASGSVTIAAPDALTVNITGASYVCANSSNTLTAVPAGRVASFNYVWKKSTDGITFNTIAGANAATLTENIDQNYTYKVYVCDGECQAFDDQLVEARPIPVLSFDPVATKSAVSIAIPGAVATLASTLTTGSYTAPVTYVWQVSTNGGTTWAAVNGSTSPGTYTDYTTATLSIANLTLAMNNYQYKVIATDASGCSDENTITLVVSEGPVAVVPAASVSCFGLSDAALTFDVSEGEVGLTYALNVYKGTYTKTSQPVAQTPILVTSYNKIATAVPYALSALAAGPYTIEFIPGPNALSLPNSYVNFSVGTPPVININVTGALQACTGSNVTISAVVNGGPTGGSKSYQWFSSTDNIIFNPIGGQISSSLTRTMLVDSYFRIEATVGGCKDTSGTHGVLSLPTPVIVADLAVDSGCYRYDLTTLPVRETTGISNYTLTLHNKMPLNVLDNSSLIPTTKYLIKNNQYVYAKMTVGGLCYDVVPVKIHIKPMDECHPVIVPEFFSPDGDGLNDLFIIQDLDEYWGPKIYVYDRFGKVVFEGGKEEMMKGWDGTYMNEPLPSADYWYKMVFEEIEPKVGYFALKRRRE